LQHYLVNGKAALHVYFGHNWRKVGPAVQSIQRPGGHQARLCDAFQLLLIYLPQRGGKLSCPEHHECK